VAVVVAVLASTADACVASPAHAGRALHDLTAPKPRCTVGAITYNDQTALVSVSSGQCFVPKHKGHKARMLRAKWGYSWVGYDQFGETFGAASHGAGKGLSFKLNPARFYTVKVVFTITTPKTKTHPQVSASRKQTIPTGGVGLVVPGLGDGPGTTPPAVVNGVNPLCPFTDEYVDSFIPTPQCGTAAPGSCAFVSAPTMSSDGTIQAGRWLCPGGQCAAPPNVARGPYLWFGYDVFFVTAYMCGAGDLVGAFGLTTITLVDADGSSCTLHPNGTGEVPTFRLPPEWGGTVKVTFTEGTFDRSNGKSWPVEYETAQFRLNGSQNGCASPNWKMESIQ
jgi:hypothetical protein